GATLRLALYGEAGGAVVSGAGRVGWWGGPAVRGGPAPAEAVQKAPVTLFADRGVQPATLQVGADPSRPLIAPSASADVLAPMSTVTSPASGAQVQSGNRTTITGTATDAGGAVAGVEGSVDGGATWSLAQGGAAWSYDWMPGVAPGAAIIRSRAIDDSGNIEAAGPGISVSIVPGRCPCTSVWDASATPTVLDVNDTSAAELGMKFR